MSLTGSREADEHRQHRTSDGVAQAESGISGASSPTESETTEVRGAVPFMTLSRQLSNRRREDDRHNYDDEEKFAILYLRIEREEKWSSVQQYIHQLFPPGTLRRQAGRGLTKYYVERRKGGLECRYYRLREDYNLTALRSAGHDSNNDREALVRLQVTLQLSGPFLERLRKL